jgi:GT2 family glycosyltransferase
MSSVPTLSLSIVTYVPDLELLRRALRSLWLAASHARKRSALGQVRLYLVDNEPADSTCSQLETLLDSGVWGEGFGCAEIISGHGNVGYGAANNLAIERTNFDFHLVMNPDVIVAEDCLYQALAFLSAHPDVGLLSPGVSDSHGNREYLCKRYPTLFDLWLRGFAPLWVRRRFRERLAHHEMRDRVGDSVVLDVPIVSGCFMMFRRSALTQTSGFSPRYFLYFEDFDLSLRTSKIARIAFVPIARIVHYGGGAAKKGPRHVAMFLRSAITFFRQHGWRWY